jgi:hypothetical protein
MNKESTLAFPWQHSTILYCWQLHVSQQYKGKAQLFLHDKYGYANARRHIIRTISILLSVAMITSKHNTTKGSKMDLYIM